MEFRQLRYFCVIAEEKKFTTAAKQLFIAQPALSQSIAQLEKELGVALFTRLSKGVDLTSAGELFYQYAKKTLQDRDAIIRSLSTLSAESGTLSVCVKTLPDTTVQVLLDFQARYPHISVDIIDQKSDLPDFIFSNCVDFPDKYDYVPLKTEPFYLLLSNKHPLATKEKVSITDLAQETIVLESNLEFNEIFLNYCRASGFYPQTIKVSPTWSQTPKMVLALNGYAALFQDGLFDLPDDIVVKNFAENITRTVWMGTIKSDYPPVALSLFRQYVQDHFLQVDQKLRSLNTSNLPSE